MKKTLKRTAAILAALLMLVQMIPALAEIMVSAPITGGDKGYRGAMEIIASKGTYVLVGQTLELDVNEGYTPKWSSSNPDVATIDEKTGVVTAIAAGETIITAVEGNYGADPVRITVIDPNPIVADAQKEAKQNQSAGGTGEKTFMVIVINAESVRYEYDGQPHTLEDYIATSNDAGFDASKVRVSGEIGVTETACGSYPFTLDASLFSYDDDSVIASFQVNNGWLKIRPAKVTVTPDKLEKEYGESDPVLTATVEGVAEGDQIQYTLSRDPGEEPGWYFITAEGAEDQGNYRVSFEQSSFHIKEAQVKGTEQPLYNLVKIGSTYYRLAKTTILTEKDPVRDPKGNLNAADYTVEDYDFTNLEIEISGKKYVYNCRENAEAIILGANYYEVKGGAVSIVKNKIGGMTNNKPNWLVPEEDRYTDKNETDSIHRDFEITLHDGKKPAVEQTGYNMLSLDGNESYYKLRTSKITAQPLEDLKYGYLKEGEYIIEQYDFTNVTVTIDGVEYRYNDGSLDEYENYFTVEFYAVDKNDRFNRNETWFKNRDTWLDGAYEEYGHLPNMTTAFHVNYKATTHKGKERPRSVTITSDWPAERAAYAGTEITMTAHLEGFSDKVRLQWQYSTDLENWNDVSGANAMTYTYILDETNSCYYWRVAADDEN